MHDRNPAVEGSGETMDTSVELKRFQSFLTLPRETIPRLTLRDTRTLLQGASTRTGLELIETNGATPIFLLLAPAGASRRLVLFQTWHSETGADGGPAIEGAEKLALATALTSVERATPGDEVVAISMVIAPAARSGSQGLETALREHRERLRADAAFWLRIVEPSTARRRIYLGARGVAVIGLRGGEANPYRIRDQIVAELSDAAYGPRPLDFELIRKLEDREGSTAPSGIGKALFGPRGDVTATPPSHPDRPRAWISFETAEPMEAEAIARRVEELSGGGVADLVERFPWDRINIHHPSIQAAIGLSKDRSSGPEIWPSSPWPSPSGLWSRTLGLPLVEWGLPLPAGAAFRLPKGAEFEALVTETQDLIQHVTTALAR